MPATTRSLSARPSQTFTAAQALRRRGLPCLPREAASSIRQERSSGRSPSPRTRFAPSRAEPGFENRLLVLRSEARLTEDVRPLARAYSGDRLIWQSSPDIAGLWWYPPGFWRRGETLRLRFASLPTELTDVRLWLVPPDDDPDPARALLPEDGPPASVIRRPG